MVTNNWAHQSLFIFCITSSLEICASNPFSQYFNQGSHGVRYTNTDPGEPLFLTPYLERGDAATARNISHVGPLNGTTIKSHSGFFTVDKEHNSNLFFWFIPSQVNPKTAPVILWLNGGPGHSSLFGLFVENGPFGIDKNGNLYEKAISWTKKYSMLYIDNPVGAGFSFTGSDAGYSENQTAIAKNLYSAVKQFFMLFPFFEKNGFFMSGLSYAGKYIPAFADYILQHGGIQLKGIAIGDGWSDPPTMFPVHADFLYQSALMDENQRDYVRSVTDRVTQLINKQQWKDAFYLWNTLWVGSYYSKATGLKYIYNIALQERPADFEYHIDFVTRSDVRKAIHVGNLTYDETSVTAQLHLKADMLKSVKPQLAQVMNNYKVMIYNGQLDALIGPTLAEAMLETVKWEYEAEYKAANRTIWRVGEDVAGYCRQVKDFYQVTVRQAGHILPYDQPVWVFDMIDRFISGKPFN